MYSPFYGREWEEPRITTILAENTKMDPTRYVGCVRFLGKHRPMKWPKPLLKKKKKVSLRSNYPSIPGSALVKTTCWTLHGHCSCRPANIGFSEIRFSCSDAEVDYTIWDMTPRRSVRKKQSFGEKQCSVTSRLPQKSRGLCIDCPFKTHSAVLSRLSQLKMKRLQERH